MRRLPLIILTAVVIAVAGIFVMQIEDPVENEPQETTENNTQKTAKKTAKKIEKKEQPYDFTQILEQDLASDTEKKAPQYLHEKQLHRAIRYNNLAWIKAIVEKYPQAVHHQEHNYSRNAFFKNGTPLHLAIVDPRRQIINYLLSHKANVNAKNAEQRTPLHQAVVGVEEGDGYHYREYRSEKIVTKVIKILLEHKANVNAKDRLGQTPLHLVKNVNLAKQLIAAKANVNAKNKLGQTPLHLTKNAEIAKQLIAAKANIAAKDNSGKTPLHTAQTFSIIKQLLAAGADPNAKSDQHETVLTHLYQVESRSGIPLSEEHRKAILLLLKHKAKINLPGEFGRTILWIACALGDHETIELLLKHGANPNIITTATNTNTNINPYSHHWRRSQWRRQFRSQQHFDRDSHLQYSRNCTTPLHVAAFAADVKIINRLLAKNANIWIPGQDGNLPLHSVILCNRAIDEFHNISTPFIQFANGENLQRWRTDSSEIVDPYEELQEHNEYTRALVALLNAYKKASGLNWAITLKNQQGQSPLQIAIENEHYDCANLMLPHVALNQTLKIPNDEPILYWASRNGLHTVIERLIKKNQLIKKQQTLNKNPHLNKTQLTDFTKKNRDGKTVLEIACKGRFERHSKTVEQLLKTNALFNTKNDHGETLLHIAIWNARTVPYGAAHFFSDAEIIQQLLKKKPSLTTVKDRSGSLPIHLAAQNLLNLKLIKALLVAGKNINATNDNGSTALHFAAWNGNFSYFTWGTPTKEDLVIWKSPIPDDEIDDDEEPKKVEYQLVKFLIENKADIHAKDNDGLTPLHKAAWNGHLDIVKQLIAAGADPNAKDNDGYTALVKAKEQKRTAVVAYLQSLSKK